jgi:hypothetical protein
MDRDSIELQTDLRLEKIEDLAAQPALMPPSKESFQQSQMASHTEIATRTQMRRLFDDDHIDQALKATHILKLRKSHAIEGAKNHLVNYVSAGWGIGLFLIIYISIFLMPISKVHT